MRKNIRRIRIGIERAKKIVRDYQPLRKLNDQERKLMQDLKDGITTALTVSQAGAGDYE